MMHDRVLNINLFKIKLNLKRNFKFFKTRLLLRQLFLTEIRNDTSINYLDEYPGPDLL